MTRPADDFAAFCCELLATAGEVRARRMFGGHGLYADGLMIALVAGQRLYLKTDADTRDAFAAAGSQPFVYRSATRTTTMSYWSAPESALDTEPSMRPWARLALAAALRQQRTAPPKRRRAAAAPKPAPAAPPAARSSSRRPKPR